MRKRIALIALFAAVGLVGVAVAASTRDPIADATCSLPGTVPCLTDPQCTPYGALCDVQSGACVCAATDFGTDLGATDLGGADFGGDGGGGSGGAGGGSGGGLGATVGGGGMTGPLKTGGCSYALGAR